MNNQDDYSVLTRSIFSNSALVIAGNILKNVIAIIVSIRLARYLGVSDFGVFNYVFAFIYFFDMLPKLGIDAILVREIAHNRKEAQGLLGNALSLRVILSLAGMLLVCIIITAIKGFSKVSFLVYCASTGLFFSLQPLYENMFKADLKMFFPMLANFIRTTIYAILVFVLIYLGSDLFGFVIVSILSGFLALFTLIQFSKRYFSIFLKVDFKVWRMLLKESLPLVLSGIFTLVYLRCDIIILEAMKGFKAVGFYSAAYKFLVVALMVPSAVAVSLFPLMSKFYKQNLSQFRRVCAFGLKYMMMVILPVAIATFFFGDKLISLYGNRFMVSAASLKILMVSAIFSFLNTILVNAIIAAGMQKVDAVASAIMMVLNIGLNLVLIPTFSFNGASLTVVMTEFIGFIIYSVWLFKIAGIAFSDIKIPQLAAANIIFLAFIYSAKSLPFVAVGAISIVLYAALMFIFGILSKDIGYLFGYVNLQK